MSDTGWFGLRGKVALVTGASSGLGRHFALTLAAAGCTVGLAARREGYLTSLADEIETAGGLGIVLRTDVTDAASVAASVAALTEQAGAPTILVNNAGMAHGSSFLDATDDDMRSVFALNQIAAWTVAQTVCKSMIAAGQGGSVINIASITGERPIGGGGGLCRQQGGGDPHDQDHGSRTRAPRHPSQRAGPRLFRDRHESRFSGQ